MTDPTSTTYPDSASNTSEQCPRCRRRPLGAFPGLSRVTEEDILICSPCCRDEVIRLVNGVPVTKWPVNSDLEAEDLALPEGYELITPGATPE
ncbi:hypothetical protein [Kitasatospora sp. NPDC018619]|uniref:hypothetical protein n=1 Tax=unclassified Kitasatospora TaxID=2633591 RepID=UPI00379B9F21